MILCKSNNRIIAEYALRDVNKPMGIATYLTEALPDTLRDSLPNVESLEATLADIDNKSPSAFSAIGLCNVST